MSPLTVLLVENDAEWEQQYVEYLDDYGCSVVRAHRLSEAVRFLQGEIRFDFVVTNLHLQPKIPGTNEYGKTDFKGVRVIDAVHKFKPGTPCLVISGHPTRLNKKLKQYPEYLDFMMKDEDIDLDELGDILNTLDDCREQVAADYERLQTRLKAGRRRAGVLIARIEADPAAGIAALQEALEEVPALSERIPALGVRLTLILEIEAQRKKLGMLSPEEERSRREAVFFAITVCQELDTQDRLAEGQAA